MVRDFGSGMTIDELIDMRAEDICALRLPSEKAFRFVKKVAAEMVEAGFVNYVLNELWEDGHSIWRNPRTDKSVIITPTGQIRQSRG